MVVPQLGVLFPLHNNGEGGRLLVLHVVVGRDLDEHVGPGVTSQIPVANG